ncbi:MAG: hypothetical protein C0392_02255 [Syntrophus sp. (in: bacteria)]|nr:hypothetical protein [Syntrophus sp. (in: bacteria)]
MKVKGLILMVVVLTVFVCTGVARADLFTFSGGTTGFGIYQTGSGGEFTTTPDSGLSYILNTYNANARIGNAFQTFCLETNETASGGGTYGVSLSNASVYGGVGGTVNGKDPLSIGTAWLYSQFAKGALQDYNYTDLTQRKVSAEAFQNTIWWLEGELTTKPNNTFTSQVTAKFGEANAMKDNNGAYAVQVANLWEQGHVGEAGYQKQDVLVASPVPIPPSVYLLGAGLLGVVFARKRAKKV